MKLPCKYIFFNLKSVLTCGCQAKSKTFSVFTSRLGPFGLKLEGKGGNGGGGGTNRGEPGYQTQALYSKNLRTRPGGLHVWVNSRLGASPAWIL